MAKLTRGNRNTVCVEDKIDMSARATNDGEYDEFFLRLGPYQAPDRYSLRLDRADARKIAEFFLATLDKVK